jgi:hypothetical protein
VFAEAAESGENCARYFEITLARRCQVDTPMHLGAAMYTLMTNPRVAGCH